VIKPLVEFFDESQGKSFTNAQLMTKIAKYLLDSFPDLDIFQPLVVALGPFHLLPAYIGSFQNELPSIPESSFSMGLIQNFSTNKSIDPNSFIQPFFQDLELTATR